MFCSHCGAELPKNARACKGCGVPTKREIASIAIVTIFGVAVIACVALVIWGAIVRN